MKKYKARSLLNYSSDELWEMLHGRFILVFDDGVEVTTHAREVLFSQYVWEFFRWYPAAPFTSNHHLDAVLKGGRLKTDTHLIMLGNAAWAVYDHWFSTQTIMNQEIELSFRDMIAEKVFRVANYMYNDLILKTEEYVGTIDLTEFIEIFNDPRIKEINDNLKPEGSSVLAAYQKIKDILINEPGMLKENSISLALRSGLIKGDQLVQCISARGFLTDIDSTVMPNPVMRGYVQGIRSLHDSLIESRSASKALMFSKSPLEQSEYFSRRVQLNSQTFRNLHFGDCGSTEYLIWHVRPRRVEFGNVITSGDLPKLVGQFHMDKDGVLKEITAADTHLINTTIKLRNVGKCCHPDPVGVCSVCFGTLAYSLPALTNIGQACATHFAEKVSQNLLSTKHLDSSASVEGIILNEYERNFLAVSNDGNSYHLTNHLAGKDVKLIISFSECPNLTDILEAGCIENLNITHVSELTAIGFLINNEVFNIQVEQNKRSASMTYSMLHYLRSKRWNIDDLGNYVIDMSDWNNSVPFLTLPLRHTNMSDYSKDVAKMLESSVEEMKKRDSFVTLDALLVEFFDVVNSKLTVNLAILSAVLYASSVVSNKDDNFALPKPWTESEPGVMRLTMQGRSLSAMMAYQEHRLVFLNPKSYINTNRIDHIDDAILAPEVICPLGVNGTY